jgi:hypothetical protein
MEELKVLLAEEVELLLTSRTNTEAIGMGHELIGLTMKKNLSIAVEIKRNGQR